MWSDSKKQEMCQFFVEENVSQLRLNIEVELSVNLISNTSVWTK